MYDDEKIAFDLDFIQPSSGFHFRRSACTAAIFINNKSFNNELSRASEMREWKRWNFHATIAVRSEIGKNCTDRSTFLRESSRWWTSIKAIFSCPSRSTMTHENGLLHFLAEWQIIILTALYYQHQTVMHPYVACGFSPCSLYCHFISSFSIRSFSRYLVIQQDLYSWNRLASLFIKRIYSHKLANLINCFR